MEQHKPEDSLVVFFRLRYVLLVYAAIAILYGVDCSAFGGEPCPHPIDMQKIELEVEGFGLWIPSDEIVCEVCGKRRLVDLPRVLYNSLHKPEVRAQITNHERYVSQVREAFESRQAANIKTRIKTMKNGVGYSHPDRQSPQGSKDYIGATSSGSGWEIRWEGPYNNGPKAIDVLRAALDHLTHLQRTTSTSEANAKLIVHLIQAIEEYDGAKPTIGGELNDLIPKAEE